MHFGACFYSGSWGRLQTFLLVVYQTRRAALARHLVGGAYLYLYVYLYLYLYSSLCIYLYLYKSKSAGCSWAPPGGRRAHPLVRQSVKRGRKQKQPNTESPNLSLEWALKSHTAWSTSRNLSTILGLKWIWRFTKPLGSEEVFASGMIDTKLKSRLTEMNRCLPNQYCLWWWSTNGSLLFFTAFFQALDDYS